MLTFYSSEFPNKVKRKRERFIGRKEEDDEKNLLMDRQIK